MLPSTKLLLCNFDESPENYGRYLPEKIYARLLVAGTESETLKGLWSGRWASFIRNNSLLQSILATEVTTASVINIIDNDRSKERTDEALNLAIASFLYFCDVNWSSKVKEVNLAEVLGREWPEHVDAPARLQRNSEEVDSNTKYPQLLLLASEIFNALCSVEESLLHLWWQLRCTVTHQRMLDNTCLALYSQVELTAAKLCNLTQSLHDDPRLLILLLAEMSQAFLLYGRVQRVEEFLERAKNIAGLKLELKGILGKRTKFQQDNLPQLALLTELNADIVRPSAEETHASTHLPKEIELDDDVRLNSIEYTEDSFKNVKLPSLEQMLCLLSVQYLQKSQPKDNLAEEELHPYIETVLSQKHGAWSTRVAAMLIKCRLESNNKRTVERAMMQCEAIVNDSAPDAVSSVNRLSYLWGSGIAPCRCRRQQLADLYLSLGLVKAALEEFLALQLWEDVIVCYTLLQLRHKAAEVIQQQIDAKPTAKLYCLLGDATDDVSCYETAWLFSEHKSSRAQRHWGNYLFNHKKYNECIPHYEESLKINSLQKEVWLRLGYAALSTECWETAALAYRRYTYLQPNTFEAWNNLAKVYVNQGDKQRAYRALMEALKFNYDNWKLWENVITVSLDTGHFEDVVRGVHRLLDIRGKFHDHQVLALLSKAVLEDHVDADGHSSARLQKRLLELMGCVTSAHPTDPQLWQLYADLSPNSLLRAQRLQKAYRGFTQASEWPNNPETCEKVVDFTVSLLDCSLKAKMEADESQSLQAAQQLASARLTGQAVVRAAEKQNWPNVEQSLKILREKFDEVMEFLKS